MLGFEGSDRGFEDGTVGHCKSAEVAGADQAFGSVVARFYHVDCRKPKAIKKFAWFACDSINTANNCGLTTRKWTNACSGFLHVVASGCGVRRRKRAAERSGLLQSHPWVGQARTRKQLNRFHVIINWTPHGQCRAACFRSCGRIQNACEYASTADKIPISNNKQVTLNKRVVFLDTIQFARNRQRRPGREDAKTTLQRFLLGNTRKLETAFKCVCIRHKKFYAFQVSINIKRKLSPQSKTFFGISGIFIHCKWRCTMKIIIPGMNQAFCPLGSIITLNTQGENEDVWNMTSATSRNWSNRKPQEHLVAIVTEDWKVYFVFSKWDALQHCCNN